MSVRGKVVLRTGHREVAHDCCANRYGYGYPPEKLSPGENRAVISTVCGKSDCQRVKEDPFGDRQLTILRQPLAERF